MSFEEWCDKFDADMRRFGVEGSYTDITGKETWREYFEDGDTPEDAASNERQAWDN